MRPCLDGQGAWSVWRRETLTSGNHNTQKGKRRRCRTKFLAEYAVFTIGSFTQCSEVWGHPPRPASCPERSGRSPARLLRPMSG